MRNIIDDARAQALAAVGQGAAAQIMLDAGVERWRSMWRAAPNSIRLRDYAIVLQTAANMRADHGDRKNACPLYRAATALFEHERVSGALIPFDEAVTLKQIRADQAKNCR